MCEVVALDRISLHGDVALSSKSSWLSCSVRLHSNEVDVLGRWMVMSFCDDRKVWKPFSEVSCVPGSDKNDGHTTSRSQEVKLQPLPPPDYPPPGWSPPTAQASMPRRHAEIPSKYAAVPDADPGSDEAQSWDAKDRHGCHCYLRNRMCLCHIKFEATFLDGSQRS